MSTLCALISLGHCPRILLGVSFDGVIPYFFSCPFLAGEIFSKNPTLSVLEGTPHHLLVSDSGASPYDHRQEEGVPQQYFTCQADTARNWTFSCGQIPLPNFSQPLLRIHSILFFSSFYVQQSRLFTEARAADCFSYERRVLSSPVVSFSIRSRSFRLRIFPLGFFVSSLYAPKILRSPCGQTTSAYFNRPPLTTASAL